MVDVYGVGHEFRCIAERRTKLLWFIPVWLPTLNGNWRRTQGEAYADIEDDRRLRTKCPRNIIVE